MKRQAKSMLKLSWMLHSIPQQEKLCSTFRLMHVALCRLCIFMEFLENLLLPVLCLYNTCCITVTNA